MECNKEEAVRARCMAEKKMQCRDFVGARKLVQKAQMLSPDLENISQMLAVCEVHCSSETKLNGSDDLYGILQVESTVDESLIKKQYRKLALLLHPDKNKFAGAEAAFKLVGEAHRILSDQAQRSVYDMKRKASIPTVGQRPPHQTNMSSNARKQSAYSNSNGTTPMTGQKMQTVDACQTFWTQCRYCKTRYQYYRTILNKALRCQSCMSPFIAYDFDAQDVPPIFKSESSFRHPGFHQYDSQGQYTSATSQQGYNPYPVKERPSVPQTNTSMGARSMSADELRQRSGNSQMENGFRKENEGKFEKVKTKKASKSGSKQNRRMVVESSDTESVDSEEISIEECDSAESSDADSTDSQEIVKEEPQHAAAQNVETAAYVARRSARQKHNVSYNENSSDDDLGKPLSKSNNMSRKKLHSDAQIGKEQSDEEAGPAEVLATTAAKLDGRKRGGMPIEEEKPNGTKVRKTCSTESPNFEVKDETNKCPKGGVHTDERGKNPAGGSSASDFTTEEVDISTLTYPDPEFHDFDRDRDAGSFAVNQIWAVYDDKDGMPRFYAHVRGVSSTSFKVRFTWLEFDPMLEVEKEWFQKELPVACGNFVHGKTDKIDNLKIFSHIVMTSKDSKSKSFCVYPRRGEVWALYKDWNIRWITSPDQHREYEYEFVEVLTDFTSVTGISVAHLTKVKGFLTLFCPGGKEGDTVLDIPPRELLRFSHMVPSYRTTGKERQGIPEGFYELDPASLPNNVFLGTLDSVNLDDVIPRAKKIQRNGSSGIFADRLNGTCGRQHGQAAAERNSHATGPSAHEKESCSDNVVGNSHSYMSEPDSPAASNPEFHNFESERSMEKFRVGQIWALYCAEDGFPKYYALVRKVNSKQSRVRVAWLQAAGEESRWVTPDDLPVSCGTFVLDAGCADEEYNTADTFSHLVQASTAVKKRYDIYPQVGEVWALYKNWNAGWRASDLKRCSEGGEYEMVEICLVSASAWTVAILEKVDGFKAVFRPRTDGKGAAGREIPRREFLRFSHRVPSYRLTAENHSLLQGCWELDAASLPDVLLR